MSLIGPAAETVSSSTLMTATERQTALERISIRYSIANLRTFPCVSILEGKGRLTLSGAWFDISTGELWVMNRETGDFERPEEYALGARNAWNASRRLRAGHPRPYIGVCPPILPGKIFMTKPVDLDRNPLTHWDGPLGLPDFPRIGDDDFGPVFDAALAAHQADIDSIANNPEKPTIENTFAAMELAGDPLDRVSSIFWCKAGANTNDTIQAMEREISPKMSRHFSAISMNEKLFARIDDLYPRRATLGLDAETLRLVEKSWKGFVKSGAKLDASGKARLAAINEELSSLGTTFSQNVLADEKEWVMFLGEKDLAGLPEFLKSAMAGAAEARGRKGEYAVTLSRSIYEPFTTFSERRDLREKAFKAFIGRGETGGATDNAAVVKKMLALRAEKAKLVGYDSYAALKLDDTMAKTPKAVFDLLEPVWEKAREKAAADEAELQRLAAAAGSNEKLAAWDWRFYQERLRAEKYAFDEAELKPYLQLEKIIEACFDVATRLFGVSFVEKQGIPAWHPDVRVFEVLQCRWFAARAVPRRLFRAALEALRRLDERAAIGLPARPRLGADHLQHHEFRQAAGRGGRRCFRSTRQRRCSTNSAMRCTAC